MDFSQVKVHVVAPSPPIVSATDVHPVEGHNPEADEVAPSPPFVSATDVHPPPITVAPHPGERHNLVHGTQVYLVI